VELTGCPSRSLYETAAYDLTSRKSERIVSVALYRQEEHINQEEEKNRRKIHSS
jgi:formate hydrogenlyase subunit 6/NADH:ubiquinone oxidoreductase subunit I